jgi:hypothetical protein
MQPQVPNIYKRFLRIYCAYLDIIAVTETKGKLFIASVTAVSSKAQIESEQDHEWMDDCISDIDSDSTPANSHSHDPYSPESQHQGTAMEASNNSMDPSLPRHLVKQSSLPSEDLTAITQQIKKFWPNDAQLNPFECLQQQLPLSILCPRCFGDDPKPEIAFVSVDGNFQQNRFPTSKEDDDMYLENQDRRLFIGISHAEVILYASHLNLLII